MTAQSFARLAAVIFAIVAIVHLLRALAGLEIDIGGVGIPVWTSWIAAVAAGFLAYLGFTVGS